MKGVDRLLRGFAFLIACFLLSYGRLQAQEATDVSFMAGYRQDSLDWSIGGGGVPNVLSELSWRDLTSYQLRGDVTSVTARNYYFRGSVSYGWVQSGQNRDSDYAGNNRTLEFSRSVNGVDGSKVIDYKGGFGKSFSFGDRGQHYYVPLIVGYAYHSQELKMKDGRQVVSNLANAQVLDPTITGLPALGHIQGLNSSYDAIWSGPWLGFDLALDLQQKGTVTFRLEHHIFDYSAKANWNLRDDFRHPVSFEHDASGQGQVLELGWKGRPNHQDWQWGVNLSWRHWSTNSGTDTTYVTYYYDPGSMSYVYCTPYCVGKARLNGVNWSSRQINISLSREIRP